MVAERPPVAGCNISIHPSHPRRLSVPPGRQAGGFGGGMKANIVFGAGENSPSGKARAGHHWFSRCHTEL